MIDCTNVRYTSNIPRDLHSRRNRKRALIIICAELQKVWQAEDDYLRRQPYSLTCTAVYDTSDYTFDLITDALIMLGDAY
jgi:hypothetical protein